MKKWLFVIVSLVIAVTLTACGKDKNADLGEKGEIYKQVIENREALNSSHTSIFIDQLIKEDGAREELQMRSGSELSLVEEPFSMHWEMQFDTGLGEEDVKTEEIYVTKDGVYSSVGEKWQKLPDETAELFSQGQVNTAIDLHFFEQFLDRFKLKHEKGEYMYSLVLFGKTKEELEAMNQIIAANLSGVFSPDAENIAEQLDPEYVRVELMIDEKSLQLVHYNLDMKVEIVSDTEANMSITQHTEGDLSKFDQVEAIEAPEDVKKNAENAAANEKESSQ